MVNVVPLENTTESFEFSFMAKRQALGPYVASRWGWDDAQQRVTHAKYWATRPFFRIERDGVAVGTISIGERPDHVLLAEFYVLPEFQRQGIGTEVLRRVLSDAREKSMPVRLQFLKWNPVGSLYTREGFTITGESETHYQMERA